MTTDETVNKQTITVEAYSPTNLGIKAKEFDEWINYSGVDRETMRKHMAKDLAKGAKIEVTLQGKNFVGFNVISKPQSDSRGNWLDDYKGIEDLLLEAQKLSPNVSVHTEPITDLSQYKKGDVVVFKATVSGDKKGREVQGAIEHTRVICEGHGDAVSHNNTQGRGNEDATIRMAETRAIVRALRWFTHHGQAAKEEMQTTEDTE